MEADNIALSLALQKDIPQMELVKELHDEFNFDIFCSNTDIFFSWF